MYSTQPSFGILFLLFLVLAFTNGRRFEERHLSQRPHLNRRHHLSLLTSTPPSIHEQLSRRSNDISGYTDETKWYRLPGQVSWVFLSSECLSSSHSSLLVFIRNLLHHLRPRNIIPPLEPIGTNTKAILSPTRPIHRSSNTIPPVLSRSITILHPIPLPLIPRRLTLNHTKLRVRAITIKPRSLLILIIN